MLVASAHKVLEELSNNIGRFHIVFSNVNMPGMSGIELAEQVKQLYPDLSVVLTSGYSHEMAQDDLHGLELLQKSY